MEPNRSNVYYHAQSPTKKRKKQKNPAPAKKNDSRRGRRFFDTVSPIDGHLIIKKNISTVSPIDGHFCRHCRRRFFFNTVSAIGVPFCFKFSREEEAATVSPIGGPVNFILPRKKMTLNCVTYTCPSSCKKKAGTISKKMISPGTRCQSSSSKFWQRIHRTRQSTKKIWQTRQLISKKTKSKMKKMMGLQRFLLYKPFLS